MFQEIFVLTSVSLLSFATLVGVDRFSGSLEENQNRVEPKTSSPAGQFNVSGLWRLEWDDKIDGEFKESDKSCDVKFEAVEGRFVGRFEGEVLGRKRDAIFAGEVLGSFPPLITFIQREENYSCSYQIYWSPGDKRVPVGVWHDTNGASGEFTLFKYQ